MTILSSSCRRCFGTSHVGRLVEPQAVGCDQLFAYGSEEQRDDSATQTNEILKEQLDKKGVKLKLSNAQRYKLAKRGKKLGRKGLLEYASIVTPDTILAWHRRLVALKYTARPKLKTDRQKRMEVIQELCVQFAEENMSWGYGRIQGALSNVGYEVSDTTVGNILRAKGIIPAPERGRKSNWTKRDSAEMVHRRYARRVWGEVIGLVCPMRLIDKSLGESKRGVLEHASHIIFGHFGGLDEPQAAVCN